jgi:uncharacterized membrane protein (DUF2068 family)
MTPTEGKTSAPDDAQLRRRAPTLYAIIFFKMFHGLLFFGVGVLIYFQAAHDLPMEWQQLMARPFVHHLFERLRIHPENRFFERIAAQIANVTEPQMHHLAIGTMLYSLFPMVEGIGMLYRAGWAGWLAIGQSAFFVPIEMFEMAKKFSFYMLLLMIVNILIVWYLYANRNALFHHHQFHHHKL